MGVLHLETFSAWTCSEALTVLVLKEAAAQVRTPFLLSRVLPKSKKFSSLLAKACLLPRDTACSPALALKPNSLSSLKPISLGGQSRVSGFGCPRLGPFILRLNQLPQEHYTPVRDRNPRPEGLKASPDNRRPQQGQQGIVGRPGVLPYPGQGPSVGVSLGFAQSNAHRCPQVPVSSRACFRLGLPTTSASLKLLPREKESLRVLVVPLDMCGPTQLTE